MTAANDLAVRRALEGAGVIFIEGWNRRDAAAYSPSRSPKAPDDCRGTADTH